jgi:hypothetical protein
MFFFSGHNMWMIKGDPDTLWQLYAAEEAQRLLAKGSPCSRAGPMNSR